MLIRSHLVAQAAYEKVRVRGQEKELAKKYGALSLSLPAMILQNGLAQATGFLLAKGKAEHLALLDDLADVLQKSGAKSCESGPAFHQAVIDADVAQTMLLTRRSLEASGWIKRYVQGLLKTGEDDERETR
ncbi:type III-B CRISPR module-associated protein Cmr5 [Azonexus sp.]|uniref:type III-B CRISPR module-associated protein Cmr5 n=1 Tax=Azonexus sp. TaxID=1872668 RepID=UPI0035B1DE23